MLIGNKTIAERLSEGERVGIDNELLECVLENVPHITLFTKLKQLETAGVISSRPSRKIYGASVFTYEGRRLKLVPGFKGESKWTYGEEQNFVFSEASDVALDPKTKAVLAYAPTLA